VRPKGGGAEGEPGGDGPAGDGSRRRKVRRLSILVVVLSLSSFVFVRESLPAQPEAPLKDAPAAAAETGKKAPVERVEAPRRPGMNLPKKEDLPPFKMIYVEGGCFEMGDATGEGDEDERPAHEVCVSSYYISETEVTQRLYEAVMGENPTDLPLSMKFEGSDVYLGPDKPVTFIRWQEVDAFIERLNNITGGYYRLPSEVEWEYAARSRGKRQIWPGTDNEGELGDYAWFGINSDKMPHDVKTKKPNELGIYDMAGNVREWVNDNYDFEYYQRSPKNDPYGPEESRWRVVRGGAFLMDSFRLRSTFRYGMEPAMRGFMTGFRLAE